VCQEACRSLTHQDTYAAILAARTFRILMAITAAFDLEVRQYDAVNALKNSFLDEVVYCKCPEGFKPECVSYYSVHYMDYADHHLIPDMI
jgi:hypothetical protein